MEIDADEVFAELQHAPPRKRRGKSSKDPFAMVPLWWIEQAARAAETPRAFVLVWLLHLAWRARSMTFPIPNGALAKRGVSRWVKYEVIDALEEAGLVTVDRRHGKTPIVTLVVL